MSTLFPMQQKILTLLKDKPDQNGSFNEIIINLQTAMQITIAPEVLYNHLFLLQTQGMINKATATDYHITEKGMARLLETDTQVQ